MSSKKKKELALEREAQQEAARLFGKHVSRDKAYLLMAVTTIACALPMALGLRLWDALPEIVPTGLILATTGEDDSLPRYMVVFGLPGLMVVLNLICHGQLWYNQQRMTLPKTPVRLLGRWGFPFLSVIFCSGMILRSADQPFGLRFITPCLLGLGLLYLGGHMWDCPKSSKLALRLPAAQRGNGWQKIHRFAGWTWLIAGLAVLALTMTDAVPGLYVAALAVLAGAAPFIYGYALPTKLT